MMLPPQSFGCGFPSLFRSLYPVRDIQGPFLGESLLRIARSSLLWAFPTLG
jgi:hypothetical protein